MDTIYRPSASNFSYIHFVKIWGKIWMVNAVC